MCIVFDNHVLAFVVCQSQAHYNPAVLVSQHFFYDEFKNVASQTHLYYNIDERT